MQCPETEQKEVEETSKIGTISKDVYFGYIKHGSNLLIRLTFPIMIFCAFGAHSFADVWISKWTNNDGLDLTIYNQQKS